MSNLLHAIRMEARQANADDSDEAENSFRRIAELADAGIAMRAPATWALTGQPENERDPVLYHRQPAKRATIKLADLEREFPRYMQTVRDVIDYPDSSKSRPVIIAARRALHAWFRQYNIDLEIDAA